MSSCEVCQKNEAVGVAAMPGVPFSCAYCRECLKANAHPYSMVVANTALCGGYENTADWWKDMVNGTLTRLGIARGEFDIAVQADIKAFDEQG